MRGNNGFLFSFYNNASPPPSIVGDYALVMGGYDGAQSVNTTRKYALNIGETTTQVASNLQKCRYVCSAASLSGFGLLFSGTTAPSDHSSFTNNDVNIERYDYTTNVTSSDGSMLSGRNQAASCCGPSTNVITAGGQTNAPSYTSAEQYNPSTKVSSSIASLNANRWMTSAIANGSLGLFAGGYDAIGAVDLASTEVYNFSNMTVAAGATMSTAMKNQLGTTGAPAHSFLFGGQQTGGALFNQNLQYTYSTNLFATMTNMLSAESSENNCTASNAISAIIGTGAGVAGYASVMKYNMGTDTYQNDSMYLDARYNPGGCTSSNPQN